MVYRLAIQELSFAGPHAIQGVVVMRSGKGVPRPLAPIRSVSVRCELCPDAAGPAVLLAGGIQMRLLRWPTLTSVIAVLSGLVALTGFVGSASGGTSLPVNYVGVNFAPITSTTSSNYNWSTGTLTPGTASASVFSTANAVQNSVADPSPPDPNGYGTFLGTAGPTQSPTGRGAVLFEQSLCAAGYPNCLTDGSLTYGYMVMYPLRGDTLDQLTNLATEYYVENGCFGGGSPRFSIVMSNAVNKNKEVQVYIGTPPAFNDCPTRDTWQPTGNLATDSAGTRWDTSQIGGSFYSTYSAAVALADAQGYKIDEIILGTDGGWDPTTGGNQTFLFQKIQTNGLTRFP